MFASSSKLSTILELLSDPLIDPYKFLNKFHQLSLRWAEQTKISEVSCKVRAADHHVVTCIAWRRGWNDTAAHSVHSSWDKAPHWVWLMTQRLIQYNSNFLASWYFHSSRKQQSWHLCLRLSQHKPFQWNQRILLIKDIFERSMVGCF